MAAAKKTTKKTTKKKKKRKVSRKPPEEKYDYLFQFREIPAVAETFEEYRENTTDEFGVRAAPSEAARQLLRRGLRDWQREQEKLRKRNKEEDS